MLSTTQAARSLRSCMCQLSRMQVSSSSSQASQPSRQASTSSSSSKEQLGWLARIRQGAQKGAVDRRPPNARVEREMQKMNLEQGDGSLFDKALAEAEVMEQQHHLQVPGQTVTRTKLWTEHKTSTGLVPTSPRKLNEVARLIQKKPIDYAILQAQMSDKRVAKTRVKSMLCLARDHAIAKGLDREKLVVQRAWVTKGVYLKRLDIKGRGRFGVKMRPESRLHVVLAPGPSRAEMMQQKFDKLVKQRLRTGAGYVREDRPIININNMKGSGAAYAW